MNATALEGVSKVSSSHEDEERSAEDLRQEVEARKEALAETIGRLDARVHQVTDWRAQVSDHPFLALGVAATAGCLASRIFDSKPTPGERVMDALAEGFEELTGVVRDRIGYQLGASAARGALKAALLGFVVKAATNYLSNKVESASRSTQHLA